MKRELAALSVLALSLFAVRAHAQDPHNAGPIPEGAPMPAGHPTVPAADDDEDDDTPPPAANPRAGGPHAGAPQAAAGDPPEDSVADDPSVGVGTIAVQIADPTGHPLGRTEVTLGILYNSVAKGESRKRVTQTTDDNGIARFTGLDTGSGVAYRPMVLKDGATFSSTPFPLGPKTGIRALIHVYPVTSDLDQSMVVMQAMLYAEVKDDRVQIQQGFRVYNFGKTAWVPKDYVVPLPENFTAFATQQGMTDIGVDAVEHKGVRIHGTFPPGQNVLEFRWQLPYSGEANVKMDVGMPSHLAAAKVIVPAGRNMNLDVTGFGKPRSDTDGQGQRALVAERQMRREEAPMKSIQIEISGMPTEGSGKYIASFLAFGALAIGIVLSATKHGSRDTKREREQLFASLEALEQGHRDGSIGPKTYERARREIIDDIARTFSAETPAAAAQASKTKKVARPAPSAKSKSA